MGEGDQRRQDHGRVILIRAVAAALLASVAFGAAAQDVSLDDLIARAKQRDADAEYTLGMMAYEGRGVPRDTVKARDLLGQAASLGNERASEHLTRLLGPGLPQPGGGDPFKGMR